MPLFGLEFGIFWAPTTHFGAAAVSQRPGGIHLGPLGRLFTRDMMMIN